MQVYQPNKNFVISKLLKIKPIYYRWALFFICVFACIINTTEAFAQNVERRVEALENYVSTIGPTMQQVSNSVTNTLQNYSQRLEVDLQNFSQNLQASVDSQILQLDYSKIQLDPSSTAFQRIDSNVGIFLVAVSKLESIDGGVRLHLNIGNMHNADFSDFSLSLLWGTRYNASESVHSWENWRKSLKGAKYTFQGKLKKGRWSPVSVDLVPSDARSIQYIECQMTVAAVELESW